MKKSILSGLLADLLGGWAATTERHPLIRRMAGHLAGAVLFATPVMNLTAATSEWVHPDAHGRLVYKTDAKGNRIPDFSQVGYRGGGVALPQLPVRVTLEPGSGDAGARIQAAIDQVSRLPSDAEGRRGAVLLKPGRYEIAGSLALSAGGVVLRGEGNATNGTVLVATGTTKRSLIVIDVPEMPGSDKAKAGREKERSWMITDAYVPVNANRLHVSNPSGAGVNFFL